MSQNKKPAVAIKGGKKIKLSREEMMAQLLPTKPVNPPNKSSLHPKSSLHLPLKPHRKCRLQMQSAKPNVPPHKPKRNV